MQSKSDKVSISTFNSMETEEQIQLLQDFLRRKQTRKSNDSSSSDSDTDTGNSFNSSNTGSNTGTPRSTTSNDSSLLTSPRSNLLWDHGYDVSKNEIEQSNEKDSKWRQFSNKTDDDKLIADKCTKSKTQTKLVVANSLPVMQESNVQASCSTDLPDLIPSSVPLLERDGSATLAYSGDVSISPPTDHEAFTDYDFSEIPPPLPLSSPPDLNYSGVKYPDSDDNCLETTETKFVQITSQCLSKVINNEYRDDGNTSDSGVKTPLSSDSEEESSSAEGDVTSEKDDSSDDDNDGNNKDQRQEELTVDSGIESTYLQPEYFDDIEAEFESILKSLNMDTEVQNTYVERFAGRRDRYGFILSPIVEAPSPTPSSLSGYSGYSGISCSSPDPFGVFRMSPAPNRGSRQELDLSSLTARSGDTELMHDQTVPIYQTVQAKKVIIIPEGIGWDSGDDLLSPAGTGEWDKYDNGLSTPPVSTTSVNLTQFGTHVTGWKLPDIAIYEESEQDGSDTTVDDLNQSHQDSDDTVEGDSENDKSETNEQREHEIDISSCKDNSAIDVNLVSLENNFYVNFHGYNAEIADINSNADKDLDDHINENRTRGANSVNSLHENIDKGRDSNDSHSATEDDALCSDSCDDAEDEYSESDNETEQPNTASIGILNMTTDADIVNEIDVSRESDRVSVTEMLSPRSANLLSGSMFPEDSETTAFSSDEETSRIVTPEPNMSSYGSGIKISQYTSGDSDDQRNSDVEYSDSVTDCNQYGATSNDAIDSDNIKNETRPVTIQKSLDFSLLDSSFDNISIGEVKKSPRIFGRYYTDMDKNILEEVQARCETPRSETEKADNKDRAHKLPFTNEAQSVIDSPDESFQNIQFIHSPRQLTTVTNVHNSDGSESDIEVPFSDAQTDIKRREQMSIINDNLELNIQSAETSEIKDKPELQVKRERTQALIGMPEFKIRSERKPAIIKSEPELKIVRVQPNIDPVVDPESQLPKPKNNSANHGNNQQATALKSILKTSKYEGVQHDNVQKPTKSKEKSSDVKKPVNIKISHLARKDSGRAKVKRGYVHELSMLFNKGLNSQKEDKTVAQIKKKAQKAKPEPSSVNRLTPNNDIVLDIKRYTPETICEEFEPIRSLGFDVTPLQKVSSFKKMSITNTACDNNNDQKGEKGKQNTCDGNSDEDSDNNYKEYSTQLEHEIEIQDDAEDETGEIYINAIHGKQEPLKVVNDEHDRIKSPTDDERTAADVFADVVKRQHETENRDSKPTPNDNEEKQREPTINKSKADTTSECEKSSVNMTDIMWRIPWKTRKQRNAEKETKRTDTDKNRSEKPSGYLFDLISRIEKTDQRSTKLEPIERQRSAERGNTPGVETYSEAQDCILNENNIENSEEQPIIENDNEIKEIQEDYEMTAVNGHGESCNLDSLNSALSSGNSNTFHQFEDGWNVSSGFDDSQFEIRYPSSLSRRLYGPYCRLRGINNDENTDYDSRETTPEDLSPIPTPDRQSYPTTRQPLTSRVTANELNEQVKTSRPLLQSLNMNTSLNKHSISEEHLKTVPSSICADREICDHVGASYTHSDTQIPLTRRSQHGGFKFNTKPITNEEINRASRAFKIGENNFVGVTLPSDKPQSHLLNEPRRDKQDFDFSQPTYYGNASGNSDCDTVILSDKLHGEIFVSIENSHKYEDTGNINVRDLGVDSNMVTVKNGLHQPGLGVHIPTDEPCNETRPQDMSMNNEDLSTKGKLATEKTNLPGINYMYTPKATYNIHSHQLMSSGNETGDDKRLKNGGYVCEPEGEETQRRTSVVLQTPEYEHVLEDEKGHLRLWPYSDFDNTDKLPVTLHRARRGINIPIGEGMSDRPASMTVIQSAERSTEMPENRMVQKYHTSSILPADRSSGEILKAHGESVQSVLLHDSNGNTVSEEELATMLPKIAASISKMEKSDAEEILPGITQSITKLKNGGNLVITTMTRKLDEDESGSSGRGSPEPDHPVLNVDDLENSKIFLVQDSKGELFYVEDVTSETQESAYFSSRNTSESISETGNSPTFDRISKIQSIGRSGINDSTAQELLANMYGDSDIREITENEEEWSERTYEYDLPKKSNYSKDSFKTSYMVEEPGDTVPKLKTATTKDKYESSYNMTGGSPWLYDGGMSQSYSQVTQGVIADDMNNMSVVATQNTARAPITTIERYTLEGEATDYPMVPVPPQPLFIPPPPMVVQTDIPQFSLVKVDVTPKTKDEGVLARIEAPPKPIEPDERPIYKTVATIHTSDKLPAPKPPPREHKTYKIIASKATEQEEQESHMRFDEIDYKFSSENVEYKMRPATTETQFFVRNSTKLEAPKSFRSEKRIELGRQSDQKYKSEIKVQETKPEVYEQSSYSYDQMRSEMQQSESNMRVVRGSYLIKNTLNDVDGDLDDNINMFDGNFTMCKDNPLYKSDEDIYMKIERERQEENRRQEMLRKRLNHDITFETVDKFSKSKTVKREAEKKMSLYELLMSRISTIDKAHIRQNIDVKHSYEDIYGDLQFQQADGQYLKNMHSTNDFDTVGEKVDLMIKEGKAFITIKVTAERITPVDLEFNVWRKNQAVVTRTIEVDLLATEKRRRIYYKVMETPGGGHGDYRAGPNETILDSHQTLDLFTKILGAADGEGDVEDIEVRTRGGRTTRPYPGMDLLY